MASYGEVRREPLRHRRLTKATEYPFLPQSNSRNTTRFNILLTGFGDEHKVCPPYLAKTSARCRETTEAGHLFFNLEHKGLTRRRHRSSGQHILHCKAALTTLSRC